MLLLFSACKKDSPIGDETDTVAPYTEPNNDGLGDANVMLDGSIDARFSVSETRKVAFSRGNLQYCPSRREWRFALHQYDIAHNDTSTVKREYLSAYTGWVDLFGWGTSGYHNPDDAANTSYLPYSTSNNYYSYGPSIYMPSASLDGESAHYDWGVHNPITNGGADAGQWRTLAINEWEYLVALRPRASEKRGVAKVEDISGFVLLPDEWLQPAGCSFSPLVMNEYNKYQWRTMQQSGAVFLPAAGTREGVQVMYIGQYGSYWSSTCDGADAGNAKYMQFSAASADAGIYSYYRSTGMSVRLVKEIF